MSLHGQIKLEQFSESSKYSSVVVTGGRAGVVCRRVLAATCRCHVVWAACRAACHVTQSLRHARSSSTVGTDPSPLTVRCKLTCFVVQRPNYSLCRGVAWTSQWELSVLAVDQWQVGMVTMVSEQSVAKRNRLVTRCYTSGCAAPPPLLSNHYQCLQPLCPVLFYFRQSIHALLAANQRLIVGALSLTHTGKD